MQGASGAAFPEGCALPMHPSAVPFWPARSTRMPLRAHYERVFRTFAPFVVTP
jgi:hypothetical protein